ncbi:MAG: Ig-like domain-containing protein, partial [Pirellulales bacterium]|nr:Ig-like domain-containing protein [Pirellulales bacterium]
GSTASTGSTSSTGSSGGTGGTGQTSHTLVDVHVPLPLQVAIQDTEMLEDHSDPQQRVRVRANQPVTSNVTVSYQVVTNNNPTATRDVDYTLADGSVTILAGQQEAWIDVTLLSDSLQESLEFFDIQLTHTSSGSIASDQDPFFYPNDSPHDTLDPDGTLIDDVGTVWIADDDSGAPPPWIDVSINNADAWEGESAPLTVTLSEPASHELRLDYQTAGGTATAGSDYTSLSGLWTIPAGETTATFSVDLSDDAVSDSGEYFDFSVSNTWWNSSASGRGFIHDDESAIRIVDSHHLSASEGENKDFLLAVFHHSDAQPSSHHTVTVSWGDGTSSAGSVVKLQTGQYQVWGNHTYTNDGSYSVLVTIEDNLSTLSKVSRSRAVIGNVAPVVQAHSYTVSHGRVLSELAPGVLAGASDAGNDTLTVRRVSGPQHGTLTLLSSGEFSYDPHDAFVGTDSFSFQPFDGTDFGTETVVTLQVTNAAPVAVNDAGLSVPHDRTSLLNLLGNDSDADQDVLVPSIVSAPVGGSAQVLSDGSVLYTPNAGFLGTDTLQYRLHDGRSLSNIATVDLSVVNSAPVTQNGTLEINEDTPVVLSAGDFSFTDAQGDALSLVRIDSLPAQGALTLGGAAVLAGDSITLAQLHGGELVFTPAADAHGTAHATIHFSVSDGLAFSSGSSTLTIHVVPVNDPPAASDSTLTLDEDTTHTLTVADFAFQ